MSETRIFHPGATEGRQPWLRPVDFSAPSTLPPDQQARLRRLVDDLEPIVRPRATADLGISLSFKSLWVRELTWREGHPIPADDAVTTTIESSAGGRAYLILDPTLASLVVERLLGTEPDPARPLRSVTAIDRALLSRMNDLLVSSLDRLWGEATGASLHATGVRSQLDLVAELDPTDLIVLVAVEVKIFNTLSVLHLAFPQPTLAAVGAQLSRPSPRGSGEDPATTRTVQARLGEASVEVQVRLGDVELTAGEIAALHPGDRVPLSTPATAPAALIVDGVAVQFGHIGRSGTHRAVRVGRSA
ncbi:MAG: FliM/FliN family flagellar motor switch protein [Solirubrobacteraceae bacterium]|nr:FliM/FliN family flagellar motor switch protein [Solirubrobacteraceae bacterium]